MVLKIEARAACTVNTAQTRAIIPRADGDLKPVLRFWHPADGTDTEFDARTTPLGGLDRLFHPGADWVMEELCVEESYGGQLMMMNWEVLPRSGTCEPLQSPLTVWIDDIELTLSDTCP